MDERHSTPSSIFDRWPPGTLVSMALALLFLNFAVQDLVHSWLDEPVSSLAIASLLTFWGLPLYLLARTAPEGLTPTRHVVEELTVHPLRGGELALILVVAVAMILPLDQLGGLNQRWIEIPPEALEFQRTLLPGGPLDGALTFLALALVVPIGEEIVFRGIVQQACRVGLGAWPAVLVSGALFGLLHLQPWFVLPLVATGIVLGLVYEITGTLWAPVALHVSYNAIVLGLWMGSDESSTLVGGGPGIVASLLSVLLAAGALRALARRQGS